LNPLGFKGFLLGDVFKIVRNEGIALSLASRNVSRAAIAKLQYLLWLDERVKIPLHI